MYYIDRRWNPGDPWLRLAVRDTYQQAVNTLELLEMAHGGESRIVTAHGDVVYPGRL